MQHIKHTYATCTWHIETENALMKQYLVIMHNDAHDQVLTAF